MAWPLYMDHHVPSMVTAALRARGIDVLTAGEDQAAGFDDEALLARATHLKRILVTQDLGFLSRAANWLDRDQPFFGIAFSRQQRISHAEFVEWLELVASLLTEEEVYNQVVFLPMR
jgi:predicted nuclease of predicted toxin-antitoxin system